MSGTPEQVWRAALADGRLLLQRARSSGTVFFPPRLAEPGTGDDDIEWIAASGLGTVYAATTVHRRLPEPSYNVALVDLDEHVRVMSRVEGVDAPPIGLRVRARIAADGGAPVLLFDPA